MKSLKLKTPVRFANFVPKLFETYQDNQDAGKEGFPLKVGLLLLDEHSEVWDHVEQGDKDHGDSASRKHPPGARFQFSQRGISIQIGALHLSKTIFGFNLLPGHGMMIPSERP